MSTVVEFVESNQLRILPVKVPSPGRHVANRGDRVKMSIVPMKSNYTCVFIYSNFHWREENSISISDSRFSEYGHGGQGTYWN